MGEGHRQIERILVGLAVEKTLLQHGKLAFDTVEGLFWDRYRSTIMDSYDHPEYLAGVLREAFRDSYQEIVGSIEEFLLDFRNQDPIEEFIVKISG